jgi:hypothetical protein
MTSSNEPGPMIDRRSGSVLTAKDIVIPGELVEGVDRILDAHVGLKYKEQPLAQDWARICKRDEEHGEAIEELILATGQNPRKGTDPEADDRLLYELADRLLTDLYALQHFTKDIRKTKAVILATIYKHEMRLRS